MLPHRFVSELVILSGLIFNVISKSRIDEKCGLKESEIQVPWLVAYEVEDPVLGIKSLNTGVLINKRHVIAIISYPYFIIFGTPKSVYVGLENIQICTTELLSVFCTLDIRNKVQIEDIFVNPDDSNDVFQISLIKMSEEVPYSDITRPICLPSHDSKMSHETDKELNLTGIIKNILYKKFDTIMSTLDKPECEKLITNETESIMTCAKVADYTKNCVLRGAALMRKRGNHYELVGLLENNFCNVTKVFFDLSPHLDWIRSEIPELSFEDRSNGDECGRRKVEQIELIMNGESTKAGDWPWHVAVNAVNGSAVKYMCGGTLISKNMVLTAAHCATVNGKPVGPNTLSVILGKYNLFGGDVQSQERQVHSVIVHEDFKPKNYFENDIALLKLRTEAIYSDYVQAACIWSNNGRLSSDKVFGTVVGWGFDNSGGLSGQLKQAKIPKVSDIACINTNPTFFANALGNEKKFCAGWANGTSACNGDSGGGFLVFVPDTVQTDASEVTGSWYIRGIASINIALKNTKKCDPNQYAIFTDIEKYTDWIQTHLTKRNQSMDVSN